MEKSLGQSILDQINLAFWKKKKEDVVKNEVEIDGECLDNVESSSSEYWSRLSGRRRKLSTNAAVSAASILLATSIDDDSYKDSDASINHGPGSEPLVNGISDKNCEHTAIESIKDIHDVVVKNVDVKMNIENPNYSLEQLNIANTSAMVHATGALHGSECSSNVLKTSDIEASAVTQCNPDIDNGTMENVSNFPKKKTAKKKSIGVTSKATADTTPQTRNRRQSQAPDDHDRNRRDSGVVSPLSFNSLHEKFQALSRDNSNIEIPTRRPSKVNKLDTYQLAAVKIATVDKPKELAKVTPKINSQLQSRIMKFGQPSSVKIPVKKTEPSLSYSAVGGYAIRDGISQSMPQLEGSETVAKRIKGKAPQPSSGELSSQATAYVTVKAKKIKGRAPQPPDYKNELVSTQSEGTEEVDSCISANEQSALILEQNSCQSVNNINNGINLLEKESVNPIVLKDDRNNLLESVCNDSTFKTNEAFRFGTKENRALPIGVAENSSLKEVQLMPLRAIARDTNLENSNTESQLRISTNRNDNIAKTSVIALSANSSGLCSSASIIPKIVQGNIDLDDDNFQDCETPKAERKFLHLSDDKAMLTCSDMIHHQDDVYIFSRRSGGSSESDSFHTPSPRPKYSSRGELLDDSMPAKSILSYPAIQEAWTPSPEDSRGSSPMSDLSDSSYDHYVTSVDYSVRSLSIPRRIFPKALRPSSYIKDWQEDTPVVFDATLSFDLCSSRAHTPVRQLFRASPAHSEPKTASNDLSCRIAEFLDRTDHVMDEWKRIGRTDPKDIQSLVELPRHRMVNAKRSKSAANIMIKGFQYFSPSREFTSSSYGSWRSSSTSRYSVASDRTLADLDELNEVMCDLSEERSAVAQTTERLEAEISERIRLEQEVLQLNSHKEQLENAADKMEMELHYARATDNGITDIEDLSEDRDSADLFKKKIDRLKRETELLRQQLRQQHEDDLEQLVALKKQLEKRLADANEEVDEQRKVVVEWKKKTQKVQDELTDTRILVQEEYSRNAILEKKQRRFDAELQNLEKSVREEKNAKERIARERDAAVGAKILLEQTLSSVRSDLLDKECEVKRLNQELDYFANGGATEQEVTLLKKSKLEMDRRVKELEADLDELSGQLSIVEGAKLKADLSLEVLRNEKRKELAQKEDEIEEVKSSYMMKLKTVEMALEAESEERSLLVRQRMELMRRLSDLEDNDRQMRAYDEETVLKLKRDLRKTKALLRDAECMLEKTKEAQPAKDAIKTLKNQLEDAEMNREAAVKAKQKATSELVELTGQLEATEALKKEAEKRAFQANREINDIKAQLEDNEEDLAELMKKYQQHIAAEEHRHKEAEAAFAQVESERDSLRIKLSEAIAKIEAFSFQETTSDSCQICRRHISLIQDLKNRRELDETVQKRLEAQLTRTKENVERLNEQVAHLSHNETVLNDQVRKLQSTLRESKEEVARQVSRIDDLKAMKKELDNKVDEVQKEAQAERAKARLAEDRLFRMQTALNSSINDTDSDPSGEEES